MKILIVILGVLAGLAAGFLGSRWLGDFGELSDDQRAMAQLAGQGDELMGMGVAGIFLLLAFIGGLAGAIFAMRSRFSTAGWLMVVTGIIPVFFAPQSFLFTCLLVAGGALALLHNRKTRETVS